MVLSVRACFWCGPVAGVCAGGACVCCISTCLCVGLARWFLPRSACCLAARPVSYSETTGDRVKWLGGVVVWLERCGCGEGGGGVGGTAGAHPKKNDL